jgi:tRNA threonylcarbamoyladenosine biosynthesis protein TsaB
MKLLALDTATEACTVALGIDGRVLERFERRSQHSEHLLPMIDALLAEAQLALGQLDAIAFGRGPGSFTGLRIGAGVAQGLAFGAELPVVPVSSLATLAQGQAADRVLAAFDARMQQVYWGAYRRSGDGVMEPDGSEQVLAPAAVPHPEGEGWAGAGSGWDAYAAVLEGRLGSHLARWVPAQLPHARDMLPLAVHALRAGRALSAEQALPLYIRDDVAARAKVRG